MDTPQLTPPTPPQQPAPILPQSQGTSPPLPPEDEINEEHPMVEAVKNTVTNLGWIIQPHQAVELVQQVKQDLVDYQQRFPTLPPDQQKPLKWEAERIIREITPELIENPDGDKPEIPDDLFEELAGIIIDHHRL